MPQPELALQGVPDRAISKLLIWGYSINVSAARQQEIKQGVLITRFQVGLQGERNQDRNGWCSVLSGIL
jgi:hypothetical protein